MSEESWFALHGDDQVGPVSFDGLLQMIRNQALNRDDLVWLAGTPGWVPAHQVPRICEAADWGELQVPAVPTPSRPSLEEQVGPRLDELRIRVGDLDQVGSAIQALPHLRWVQNMLDSAGRQVTSTQLDNADRLMKRGGSIAYMIAGLLFGVYFAAMSLKVDSIQQFLASVLIVIPMASMAHFTAVHFLEASSEALRSSATKLSSEALAKSLGLLLITWSILSFVISGHNLFNKVEIFESIVLLSIGLCSLYLAAACLNPSSLNVEVDSEGEGVREMIGITQFVSKLCLRVVPVAFGLFSFLAAGTAVYFCLKLLEDEVAALYFLEALSLAPKVLAVGFLPFALYLLAILGMLVGATFRAWLDTAGHLHKISTSGSTGESRRLS